MAKRPVLDAIIESVRDIEIRFDDTPESFRGDRAQTAGSRETSVKEFLKSYFPSNWSVKKGPIYDVDGNSSREVDCALCIPEHPPCTTPKRELILAEGVHFAIEVKPDISSLGPKSEIVRALQQAASVKALKREMLLVNPARRAYPPETHKIPFAILASKTASLKGTAEFIDNYKQKESLTEWDLPDIVVGLEKGLIIHAPSVEYSVLRPFFEKGGVTSGEVYWLVPSPDEALPLFLSLIYSFSTPVPTVASPILQKYLLPLEIKVATEVYGVT